MPAGGAKATGALLTYSYAGTSAVATVEFKFADFTQAIQFINQVAELANQVDHHPSILNNYNVVEIWLCTHDDNNQITAKDHELANMINKIK